MKIITDIQNSKGLIINLINYKDEFYNDIADCSWSFNKIKDKLIDYHNKVRGKDKKKFIRWLIDNYKEIICSDPTKLQDIINEIEKNDWGRLFYNKSKKKTLNFGKKILKIFDYNGFRKSKKCLSLAQGLNIKACLYCNAQFTLGADNKGKELLLFQFDHYYSKSEFPYLSVSLFNLIPVCSNCNHIKRDASFNLDNYFHPYINDIDDYLKFNIDSANIIEYLIKKPKKIEIQIDLNSKYIGNTEIENKIKNHKDTFALDSLYSKFDDFAEELLVKAYCYNDTRKEEIKGLFEGLHISDELIERSLIGNYIYPSDINKRPLAKMCIDIAKQLKLLK